MNYQDKTWMEVAFSPEVTRIVRRFVNARDWHLAIMER